ncbi:MAG: GldG family protein [Chloroflexi bacterium]|nr:GldG family protein [Chloroflexota bacterium]
MKQLKVIAPYLSIVGLIVLLSSLIVPSMAVRQGMDAPDWLGRSLAIAGAVLVLAWPVFRFEDLREILGTRQARYGGNALVLLISFLAILGVVNFFGTRYFRTWDLTENKQFTISNKTVQILEGLQQAGKAVQVTAILSGAPTEKGEFERLAEQYRQHFPGAELSVLDPVASPFEYNALVERIGEQAGNRVLVAESGEAGQPGYRHALVYSSFDEQAITEAIVKATRDEDKRILFTAGHGEYSLEVDSERGRSYSTIKSALEKEGYSVDTLNLVTSTDTSIDAAGLVIAGPQTAFRDSELQLLEDYLSAGGGLLVMLDPGSGDAGLGPLLARWGLGLRQDVVLDPARNFFQEPSIPAVVGDGYQFHSITKDLVGSEQVSVFPSSSSIEIAEAPEGGQTVTPLFETTSEAWGETDLQNPQAQKDPEDAAGPLTLGAASEIAGEGGGRLVLLGSGQLAADGLLQQLQLSALIGGGVMNGDLILNAANWLAQDDLLIGIEPTAPDSHPINVPQSPLLLLLSTVLLLPLAVAAVGFWIWWGRR